MPAKLSDFNQKIPGKKQAAFVIFYALDGKPWEGYPQDNSGRHQLTIPTCLMMNRADGSIGFVGGKVEPSESLNEAAIREVKEEIGHDINLELEPIVAHEFDSYTSHIFACQMSYPQLRNLQKDATEAEHFGSEVTGIFLPHLIDYQKVTGKKAGIINLLKACMATSVREEFVHFLLKKEIFSQTELEEICQKAGYSLEELLK